MVDTITEHLPSELVIENRIVFRARIADRLTAGHDVTLDASRCGYMDSSGCGALAALHKHAVGLGRRMVLRGLSDDLRLLMALTRLNQTLHIDPPVLDAEGFDDAPIQRPRLRLV